MVKNSEKVYAEAMSLAKAFDDNFVDLAKELHRLQENDPDRFRDFINATGMSRRKVYYLVAVDKTFTPLKIPKKKLVDLGWTKLTTIQPHVTKQNVHELLEIADKHNVADIKRYLKGEPIGDNSKSLVLYFSPEEHSKIMEALEQHGASKSGRGLVDKEKAILKILEAAKSD
ncbi:hypothetical protein JYP52_21380 [Nitratireductor aquibiodomus]|uniref:hypothetical protein n=1 Tax=Nitratireductor TaxID=245876 RepID=UPI0013AE8F3F|nr:MULTISPECIES: hypothetical protein [Nitratireductor]MBN7763694.1 hypothetical protein [Nitratireductor aquibiodomus]